MRLLFNLLLCSLVLVGDARGWQHASEEDLLEAVRGRVKPLLVAYIFVSLYAHVSDRVPDETLTPITSDSLQKRKSSQDLEPHWPIVEDAVRKQQLVVHVMSIDCSASKSTCLSLDVKAYPAIRLYHPDGRNIRYREPRKSGPILSFLRRALRPVITDLTTPESLAHFTTSDDIVFTADFAPSEAPLYAEPFRRLAGRHHDRYSFGTIAHPDSQSQESTIRCYNNIHSETFTLTSHNLPLANSLSELLTQCTAPLIYEPIGRRQLAELATFSSQNAKSGLMAHFFTKSINVESSPASESPNPANEHETVDMELVEDSYKKEILPLAKKYAGEILFTVIDGDEHPGMGPSVGGLPADVASGVSIENVRTGELFPYLRKEISADELEEFLGDVVRGKVKSWDGQAISDPERGDGESAAGSGHDEL